MWKVNSVKSMLNPTNKKIQKSKMEVIPLQNCLAKTIRLKSSISPGVSVATHCLIVGYVARALLNRLPVWLRQSLFSEGSELIAAIHDIGKVSPVFQEKIHHVVGDKFGTTNYGLEEKYIGYHSGISQATVEKLCSKYISEIIGRHHGYTPSCVHSCDAEVYGGLSWQQERVKLIKVLKDDLKVDWPVISSVLHSDVLAGLTTVADWIGSGQLFDKVCHKSLTNYVPEALDRAGFVSPIIRKGLTFEDIFAYSPYDTQSQFMESIKTQGSYVLEAPMGSGKTEAALYVAYKILEKGDATGIYFALPTQLTSDKIYERMNLFLGGDWQKNTQGILDKSDPHRSSLLLHSSAWLRDTEFGDEGAPGRSWFNSAKRGLLAPFAVGTIDQALMAVMNVKHGFVRAFGLAGKVVILDEVHSYDNYTGTILKELVSALRGLQCTVIVLSATLTDNHRRLIIAGSQFNKSKVKKKASPYPLISTYPKGGRLCELKTKKIEKSKVKIHISSDDNAAVEEVLKRAQHGEQILWIENTVNDAQRRYSLLAARAKESEVECGLLHSRFLKIDRQKNEDKWVKLFGKAGKNLRTQRGRILVGTQVLEQSLDIDADFMVTRLCPTDMVLQRLGRLWRHRANDGIRPKKAICEAWILAPCLKDAIQNKNSFGKSAMVYSPYILCRTLDVWQKVLKKSNFITLPDNIRSLLEATYKERPEKGNIAIYQQETKDERNKLRNKALNAVSRLGRTLPESKATTRYSETESVEVLLIKKRTIDDAGVRLWLLDGSEILLPKFVNVAGRRKIASRLLKNTVIVPIYLAPIVMTEQIKWLRDYVYLGNYEESPFRVAIVLDSDELQGINQGVASEKYNLTYNDYLGYQSKKNKGSR